MLKKQHRLTTASFNEVFLVGRRLHTPLFQIIYVASDDFHASVVVGKKVYKTAVARNRLRRQLYAAMYRFSQTTPLSFTLLVIAKPALQHVPSKAVAPAMVDALQQLTSR